MSKKSKKEAQEKEQVAQDENVNETAEMEVKEENTEQEETPEDSNETEGSEEVQETPDPLAEMEQKANEWQDKYLRLSAEFDNYRKRTLKEKMELTKSAGADLLSNILPVVDDFDRAMQAIETAEDINSVKEGINLIYNKINSFLTQNGVKEIEAKEQDFDVDLHEAITKIPAPTDELKGKVVDVVQKGYKLDEKVIRYAKVVIGE